MYNAMMRIMHWDYLIIVLALAVIVPWRSRARVQALLQSESFKSGERIALYASTIAFQWITALVIVWRCSAHGLSFVGLGLVIPRMARAVTATLVISALLVANQVFGVLRLSRLPEEQRGIIWRLAKRLLPQVSAEKWTALALVLTVAVCEEFIYRGFIQSLFQALFSSLIGGATVSAGFFALAHLYQGKRGVLTTFLVGLLFSGVKIWTNSLVPSMIIHFAVDFSAGMASRRLLLPKGSK